MRTALLWPIAASRLAIEKRPLRLTGHLSYGSFIVLSVLPTQEKRNFTGSRREDPRTDALGPFDVESGLGLAVFFESSADMIECFVEMTGFAAFFEIGNMDQGQFFLRCAHMSGTRSRVPSSRAPRKSLKASSSSAVPLTRSPRVRRALPKLVWVEAQSSGIRSRGSSVSASRSRVNRLFREGAAPWFARR